MPFCITGMHRSGTSMVARALNLCGLSLGEKEQIRRFADDNVEGYWEHEDFVALNERLLAALDGAWDLPFREEPGWEGSAALEPLRQEARRLTEWFADREPWGWKDPRNALLLPFWKSIVPDLRFVVCVRDPLEVAFSLNQRGLSSLRFGLGLWEEYYRRIVAHTSAADRIVTHYASGLDDAEHECARLASFAGLQASEVAVRSMKPELRHHRATPESRASIALRRSTGELYEALRREASSTPVPAPPAEPRVPQEIPAGSGFLPTARVDLTHPGAILGTSCLVPLERTPTGFLYEATSVDPQLVLGVAPFPSSSVRAVRFRIRRETSASAVAQLYWAHGPDEDFSEQRSAIAFLEPAAAGWCEYRLRLDRPPVREQWLGGETISRLRFDPANVQGRLELESLVFEA